MPTHAVFPTGADRLHAGLFCREPGGVPLEPVGLTLDVRYLAACINTIDESVPVTFYRLANSVHFRNINTGPYNHRPAPVEVIVRRPCFTPLVLMSVSA